MKKISSISFCSYIIYLQPDIDIGGGGGCGWYIESHSNLIPIPQNNIKSLVVTQDRRFSDQARLRSIVYEDKNDLFESDI